MSAKLRKIESNIYLDDSGIYIWREDIRGESHWRSTGERSLPAARTKVKTFRIEAGEGKSLRRRGFAEIFDELGKVQAAKAKNTLVQFQTAEGHLRPWFCGEDRDPKTKRWVKSKIRSARCAYVNLFELRFETIWAEYKTEQTILRPGKKLGHDRRYLLMALKRAKTKKWIRHEFKKSDLQLLESTEPVGRLIEDAELKRLLPRIKAHRRLFILVSVALRMGMRLREILHLRTGEIDFKRGEIKLVGGRVKTRGVGRTIMIHEKALPLLKELADKAAKAGGDCLFPSVSLRGAPDYTKPQDSLPYAWDRVRKNAKVDCRFHDIRHTAISWMISAGIPLPAIHKQTGVSMVVILKIYAHLDAEMREKFRTFACGKSVGL